MAWPAQEEGSTMRTLRSALTGTVTLALLGLGGAAVAQDDQDPPITATYVSGKQTGRQEVSPGTWSEVPGIDRLHGAVYEDEIEWNDPRLSSVVHITENLDIHYREDDGDAWAWVGSIRLEDEQGAWTGTEYGMGEWPGDDLILQPRMMLLEGDGAYEGLTAMLQRRWEVGDPNHYATVKGYIFEGGLPPMPQPLEPASE